MTRQLSTRTTTVGEEKRRQQIWTTAMQEMTKGMNDDAEIIVHYEATPFGNFLHYIEPAQSTATKEN